MKILRRSCSPAFTLVELLAVVAIALVLCTLAQVGLRVTLDRAKTTQCVGNLRAITMGTITWAADRNGRLWSREELGYSKYRQVTDPMGLPQILKDYVPLATWKCPNIRPILKDYGNGYTWTVASHYETETIYTMSNPTLALLYWDAYNYTSPSMFNKSDDQKGTGSTGPATKTTLKPHRNNKLANWSYLDGHVETK